MSLRVTSVTVIASILMWSHSPATADDLRLAQASGTEKAPAATEKPTGRAEGRAVQVKGTVAAVDKEAKTVTLKGPKGRYHTVQVEDPAVLQRVKVGDTVIVTAAEALAVSLEKKGEKK